MQITNQFKINYRQNISYPSFKGNCRTVRNALGELKYRNNTAFFRPDLHCNKLIEKLASKYANVDRIHIYNYACSEGAEPFSIAMTLIKKLGLNNSQKFFPILASDIDEDILKNPIQGHVNLTRLEMLFAKLSFGKKFNDFIKKSSRFKYNQEFRVSLASGEPSADLKKAVTFKQLDILHDIENIKPDNSVVLCRNFLPYLSEQNRELLVSKLSKNLGNNSMCVIGHYDTFFLNTQKLFSKHGLEKIDGNPYWYGH